MIELFMLKEAVYSTAMEHPNTCDCTTCRAASGDKDAWNEIYQDYFTRE